MKAMFPLALAAVGLIACSSSSKSSSDSCNELNSTKSFHGTFTLTTGSSGCAASIPFNSSSSDSGSSSDADSGASSCAPVVSGCTATISCNILGVMLTGSLTATGDMFTGTGMVSETLLGTTTTCNYSLSGTYE